MEAILALLGLASVAATGSAAYFFHRTRSRNLAALRELGLRPVGGTLDSERRFQGRVDQFPIRLVEVVVAEEVLRQVEIAVDGRGRIPLDVKVSSIHNNNLSEEQRKAYHHLLDTLSAALRDPAVHVQEGRILCLPSSVRRPFSGSASLVRAMMSFAEALTVPSEEAARLLYKDVVTRTNGHGRLEAFDVLLANYPRSTITQRAAQALLEDSDPDILLRVGRKLGEEGLPHLKRAVRLTSAPHASVKALMFLVRNYPDEDVIELVECALASHFSDLRNAAIEAIGIWRSDTHLEQLVTLLYHTSQTTREATVEAIGRIGSAAGEVPLVELLEETRQTTSVTAAVCCALGELGSTRSLSVLHGLLLPPVHRHVERAAKKAIAQIHSRLSGDEGGTLSLASISDAGQVSLLEQGLLSQIKE